MGLGTRYLGFGIDTRCALTDVTPISCRLGYLGSDTMGWELLPCSLALWSMGIRSDSEFSICKSGLTLVWFQGGKSNNRPQVSYVLTSYSVLQLQWSILIQRAKQSPSRDYHMLGGFQTVGSCGFLTGEYVGLILIRISWFEPGGRLRNSVVFSSAVPLRYAVRSICSFFPPRIECSSTAIILLTINSSLKHMLGTELGKYL